MANRVCLRMGCLIIDDADGNCGGLYYEERADSVEHVRAARIEEIARRAVWILAHHPDSSHTFAGSEMEAELRALGVFR